MNYLKVIKGAICLPLSLSLTACVTTSTERTDRVYSQSMTRTQMQQVQMNQQMKVKQKQKVVQNNHHTNTVYVNQPNSQPYRGNVRQSYDSFAAPVFTPQPRKKDYGYQEDEMNRHRTEAAEIEQAKINSYNTYDQDNARRQQIAAEEERQMEQARKNSLDTYAQEEARRQQNAAVEAQNTRRAQEDSLFEAAQQQARQHEQQRAQDQAAAQQQGQQQAAAEEARQTALAIEESNRPRAEEARRQQQASARSVYDVPPVDSTPSPEASAPMMEPAMNAPMAG